MHLPDGKGQLKEKRVEIIVLSQWADRQTSV